MLSLSGEADGLLADFDEALYIFSEDAAAPDTKRLAYCRMLLYLTY